MSNNPFDQNFKEVVVNNNNNYFKFAKLSKQGETDTQKIQICKTDQAIAGWEWWEEKENKRKAVRMPMYDDNNQPLYPDASLFSRETNKPKKFFAYIVYNYTQEKFQIMQITQQSIKNQILALSRNPDWGSIDGYPITITKTQTGSENQNVEFMVTPTPAKKLNKELLEELDNLNWDLKALYKGEDPFNTKKSSVVETLNKDVEIPDIDIDDIQIQMPF